MESNADKHGMESAAKREPHEHQDHQAHHVHMAADFRKRFWISRVLTLQIPILSPPAPNVAAGGLYAWGVLLTPALGAVLMSASTVIVAINARLLRLKESTNAEEREQDVSNDPKPREDRNQKTVTTNNQHRRLLLPDG